MRTLFIVLLTLLLLSVSAPVASARATREFGPQLGFSSSPDQVVVGVHLAFREIAPAVDFVPSFDLGAGNDETVLSVNGDFHFRFPTSGGRWQPYMGAGVAIHQINTHWGPFDHNDTVAGGQLMFGAQVPTGAGGRFGVEGRFAFDEGPGFKFLAGWSHRLR